jgi:hypothetical protein
MRINAGMYVRTSKSAAEYSVHLLHILEVAGSNVVPETSHSEIIRGFPQSLQKNTRIILKLSTTASIRILFNSLLIKYSISRRYEVWATDSVVK